MTVIDNVFDHLDFGQRITGRAASISAGTCGETTVISVSGEIDASNADFTATVLNGFATWNGEVVLDLSSLDFIGTQGLRVLIEFSESCRRSNTAVAVVPCRTLQRLLQVIDIGRHLPVAESVRSAVRSVEREVTVGPQTFTRVDPEKLRC